MPEREQDSSQDPGAASGSSSPESWARWHPDTRSWRTCQHSLLEESTTFSGRWPTSGTMRNGRIYPQQTWERPTSASASSLWPTPTVDDANNVTRDSGEMQSLARDTHRWSTPMASNAESGTQNPETLEARRQRNKSGVRNLVHDVQGWSTPRAEDGERGDGSQYDGLMEDVRNWATPTRAIPGGTPERFVERKRLHNQKGGTTMGETVTDLQMQAVLWAPPTVEGNNNVKGRWEKSGDGLQTEAKNFHHGRTPPPSAEPTEPSDSSRGRQLKRGLNPRFGLWLMGFPAEWLD